MPSENELAGLAGIIDLDVFIQLISMDDDEVEAEFSRSIIQNFYEQAETTFGEFNAA